MYVMVWYTLIKPKRWIVLYCQRLAQKLNLLQLALYWFVPSVTLKYLRASAWPTWASTNDLRPDDIPVELAQLTPDEVRTVSLICPFLKVITLPGGQFGEEGSVIHFPFPVQHVMSQLPRPLIESELILSTVGVAQRETFRTLLQQIDHQQGTPLAKSKQSSVYQHTNLKPPTSINAKCLFYV